MIEATALQLNQAAQLSATRGMDFQDALQAVMQDPNAAAVLQRSNSNPDVSALLESFSRGQLVGRSNLEFEQRQIANQKRLEDVETLALETGAQLENIKRGTVGLATGFSDHLRQHAEIQAGTRQLFDLERTAALVLEGMSQAGMTDSEKERYLDSLTDLPKPKAKVLLADNKTGKKPKPSAQNSESEFDSE